MSFFRYAHLGFRGIRGKMWTALYVIVLVIHLGGVIATTEGPPVDSQNCGYQVSVLYLL